MELGSSMNVLIWRHFEVFCCSQKNEAGILDECERINSINMGIIYISDGFEIFSPG